MVASHEPRALIACFEEFELDPLEHRLTHGGRDVVLQPKVLEALAYLAARPGQLVTKDELMRALWPDVRVEEGSLTQIVYKLRRALGDSQGEARFVQNVLKKGYRFLPAVSYRGRPEVVVQAAPPEAVPPALPADPAPRVAVPEPFPEPFPEADEPRSAPVPKRRRPRTPWVLGGVVAVAGVALAVARLAQSPSPPAVAPVEDAVLPVLRDVPRRLARLTLFPEREQEPALAPNGEWFAFVSKHDGHGPFKLYAARFDGGEPLRLTRSSAEETTPRIAPDGSWVGYTRCDPPASDGCAVWRVGAMGGGEALLVPECLMGDLSPTGDALVCTRQAPDGHYELNRWSFATRTAEPLLRWGYVLDTTSWSPDGSRLVFTSQGAVWLMDAQGGQPVQVTEPGTFILSTSFSVDGKSVLVDASFQGAHNLWAIPLDGAPRIQLTSGSAFEVYPVMSRDGRRVVFTSEKWHRILWSFEADGSGGQRLDTRTTYLWVSTGPKGDELIASDEATGHLELLDLATGRARDLGPGKFPAWAPDGARVALLTGEGLGVLDLRTGALQPFPMQPVEVRPAWSPRSELLAFARAEPPGLAVLDPSDGAIRDLAPGQFRAPAWSPDGGWLAASGVGPAGSGLYVVPSAGGAARRIPTDHRSYEAAPLWTPDGAGLRVLVEERTEPKLRTLDLEGREIAPPIALGRTIDPTAWGIFDVQALPDGRWLAVEQRVEGDIYQMQVAPR